MQPKLKIGLLVAGHFIGQLACASTIDFPPPSIPAFIGLFALVVSDAGLLGIWAALGYSRRSWRLVVVVASTAYLCTLISVAFKANDLDELIMVFLVVALPTAAIFLVLTGFRFSRRRLQVGQLVLAAEGFQFSIRQLLVATGIAAGLLALSRGLGHLPTTGPAWKITIFFAIVGPYFMLVELATLWGALGIGRPLPRLLVVLPTAFVVGTMPPFFLNTPLKMYLDRTDFIAWSSFMGLQATILEVSLLVIRSCGWRLVRGTSGEGQPPPPGP